MKISEIVREMNPPRYTTSQAAEEVGRHPDTLKRWRDSGVGVPSEQATFGTTVVWLYTREDIEKLRKTARTMKPGRKPAA